MFKKDFNIQGQNLLSKKDLKSLKSQVVEQYPAIEEKVLEEVLFTGDVKVEKLDNRSLIYRVGDDPPIFFDAEGRGDVYPTLYTLWKLPYIMPELTIHPPVSKFVLNGADLMLPGVVLPANGVAGFGTITKGQKRCIKIEGNAYPIAVGKILVNQTQMEKMKGKGLEVCHVFKDHLWAHAGKHVPNKGFEEKDDEITPCSDIWKEDGASGDASKDESKEAAGSSGDAAKENDAEDKGDAVATPADNAEKKEWSQDELLEYCFLQAFRTTLADDKLLPMEASVLYTNHIIKARPEGTDVDVKKSSHKQVGKFINAMRKLKIIEVNEKKGQIMITKVVRTHKMFASFDEKFGSVSEQQAAKADDAPAEKGESSKSSGPSKPEPIIKTLWKPSHYLEPLWKEMGKSKSEAISFDDAMDIVKEYAKKEDLLVDDGDQVKLNEFLTKALYEVAGGKKKDSPDYPSQASIEEIEGKMQDRMAEHTKVEVCGTGASIKKGSLQKIEVSLARKGGHNITRVVNLEYYGLNPETMAADLKKKLNCTTHVEDMPGKNVKDKMLQMQGHVQQELGEYLLENYGIPQKFMSVK